MQKKQETVDFHGSLNQRPPKFVDYIALSVKKTENSLQIRLCMLASLYIFFSHTLMNQLKLSLVCIHHDLKTAFN